MTILLVRHTDAGDRHAWSGDDRSRPLSPRGAGQAAALAGRLADRPIDRIVSSPYTRCVQSVEPLATARGLAVETDDALAEGVPFDVIDRFLRRCVGRDVVCCSHGDVIGAVVGDLARRGWLDGLPLRWPKGAAWMLDARLWSTTGPPDRGDVEIRYLPPPA